VHADPAAAVAGYEQLRERVLAGRPDGWRAGRAVLEARGMVAWLSAWAAAAPAPATTTVLKQSLSASTPSLSASTKSPSTALSSLPDAGRLVAVLAEMALAHA
jgi:hypothetical protein